MLSFFRRAIKSWLAVAILALVAIAVVVSGVGMDSLGGGGGAQGETLASMDGGSIGAIEADRRVREAYTQAAQQQPGLTMAAFVAGGGVDATLRRVVSAKAVELWGRDHGFTASKRVVDGEIASIPAFQGPTGGFDDATFRGLLARERISEAQLRQDIAGDVIRRQILGPIAGGTRATDAMVTPYAAMLLDRRDGTIGFVPAAAMPQGPAPTQAQVDAYYRANIAAFTLPERRVLRYAAIAAPPAAAPTEAEIAAAYRANAAQYAATETRTLSQILVPTEAAARALVGRIRSGTAFAAAAQSAGFGPRDTALGAKSQAEMAALSSPAVAAAVFAAADGATTDPQKSPLGWHIVHVDGIVRTPPKALAAVRPTLVADLTKRKAEAALADRVAKIGDAIDDGATFEQAATTNGLQVVTTPPLLPTGAAPTAPGFAPTAILQPLLKAAFQAGEDDDPSVETVGPSSYALLDVVDVVPAAPIPLAQVRGPILSAIQAERASAQARQVANGIVAKATGGMPLTAAFASAGMKLPVPQTGGGRQIDLAQARTPVPPPVQLLFTMAPGKIRTIADQNGAGWYVVQLNSVKKGDIKTQPQLVAATRDEFGRALGNEYADQLIAGIMKDVNVKLDAAAIARFKAGLLQNSVLP
ncbi:peptidylprolyl isomerase [Sphingomonas montana]|uniref:peptidylprolyl isomerase n=1 Tax=Sphingomonas montana TaxID=1843236 RepID=UPI00096EA460|nr:peptidylprolyl isomerase [Sphingomonas montana]